MRDLRGQTIVFDLDGTLIETAPDLIAAVNHAIGEVDLPPVDPGLLRPSISHGARHMIKTAIEYHNGVGSSHHGAEAQQTAQFTDADLDRLFDRFINYYSTNISLHSRPFPNLVEMLDRLMQAGAGLAVCTNKHEGLARQLLDELGLRICFRAITGRDTFEVHKPHAEHLLKTIDRADGHRARGVMIGDSNTDILTARAAGLPVIGVSFGYTDVPVSELGCDAVISDYQDLPTAIDQVFESWL